ncbi:hypothetical protein K1719_004554 [Acacia pycnantha]|nr:hypothetical protein K1719_004554 [Acacia pycnantha]
MWPSPVLVASPLFSFSRSDLWRSDYHMIARICILWGRSKEFLFEDKEGEANKALLEDSDCEVVGKATIVWVYGEEAETNLGEESAWVRFPYFPVPLFDKKFLLNLGNTIGKAIRLDIHTVQRARGKFAHICVDLDLTKPLVPEFDVEG